MPRGKYVNHKGRGRSFSSPEELAREQKDLKLRKKRQEEMGSDFEEEEEESTPEAKAAAAKAKEDDSTEEDSSDEEESDDENKKKKGVEGLIEIENPNRRVMKQKKLSKLEDTSKPAANTSAAAGGDKPANASGGNAPPELSRREREVIEKQRAKERYQKLHAEGKTEEARKDLARLAIIRKEREEAAAKKAALLAEKDAAKSVKQSELNKALGKK